MHIIIIVVTGAASLSGVFLVTMLAYGLIFATSGDGEPGTINEIQYDALCYPSPETFKTYRALGKPTRNIRTNYSEDQIEKIHKEYGVIRLKKGTSVKVLKGKTFIRLGASFAVNLTPVLLTEDTKRPCYVDQNYLEMTLYEWIKWQLSS